MNAPQRLTTAKQAQEAVAASGSSPVFIYKHSTQCGISSRAIKEFQDFMDGEAPGFGYYRVDVIEARAASDEIESLALVRHESPQVLLFWGSGCVWHASHGRITKSELKLQAQALRGRLGGRDSA